METKILTIQDLAGVVSIIDVCSARGAFKGEELSTIGGLRDQAAQLIQVAEAFQAENAANKE